MEQSQASRPPNLRKSSQIPGSFETTDDELSPAQPSFKFYRSHDDSSALPPLPSDSSVLAPEASHDHDLDEGEMRRKLMDVESSFLPELSHLAVGQGQGATKGADDTFLFGVPKGDASRDGHGDAMGGAKDHNDESGLNGTRSIPSSPMTPPDAYKTPAPEYQHARLLRDRMEENGENEESYGVAVGNNTSSLETMSSSPTAAAAARTVSRVVSMVTMGGYETADDRSPERSPTRRLGGEHDVEDLDLDATPRRTKTTRDNSPSRGGLEDSAELGDDAARDEEVTADHPRKRPKFLTSRQSTQRLSYSSHHSTNTDSASDATLGADFALQSGGAAPANNSGARAAMGLSRSTSLGSMASGISDWSDSEEKLRSTNNNLSTLNEEEGTLAQKAQQKESLDGPLTPRASTQDFGIPSDTVLAAHVRDVEVPGTFARNFREKHRPFSPDKLRPRAPTPSVGRSGKTMTLKEQSSTIDRLSKENFDLKMRIHFLNEALNKRSEEGIKEMISENVELKSDKLKLQKDNQAMRRTIRDLEKRVKEKDEGAKDGEGKESGSDEEKSPTIDEEEFFYLRERMETYEVEIEKLRSESITREGEKRRLAEMVKTLGDGRKGGSEVGAREERVRSFLICEEQGS